MALVLDLPESRIVAIMEQGRGLTGFSSVAAAVAIPIGRFRRSPLASPLDDIAEPGSYFDQAYEIDWTASEDIIDRNTLDGFAIVDFFWNLRIGHIYGQNQQAFIDASMTSTTAGNAIQFFKKRALSTTARVTQALTFHEIMTDQTTDPKIIDCKQDGRVTLNDLGGGKLLSVTPYVMRVYMSTMGPYDPTSSS